jgi:probable HAF family extracellular repeat protein
VGVAGSGTVTSDPAGINCPQACSASFAEGASVRLSATPGAGFSFSGFTGVCSGPSCLVRMTTDAGVWAIFAPIPPRTLSVALGGNGGGRVTSAPAGIDCPGQCAAAFADGTTVTLSAAPDVISRFTQWSGACTGASCSLILHGDVAAAAQLDRRRYVVMDLGTLPNGYWSSASAISPRGGFVVGGWGGNAQTFFYDGVMHDMKVQGDALAVNQSGVVAGVRRDLRAYRWQNGTTTELPTLGGSRSFGQAINRDGVVAGWADRPDGQSRAVYWTNGAPVDLGSLGGGWSSCSLGFGINSDGIIVGESCTDRGPTHAVRFRNPGVIDDLGTLGGNYARARAISDSGVIVGDSNLWTSGPAHGVVWQDGHATDVGTLPGLGSTTLFAINSAGVAVGVADMTTGGSFRGILYGAGKLVDLNSLVETTPYTITHGTGIDEAGNIAAQGYDYTNYSMRALILRRD